MNGINEPRAPIPVSQSTTRPTTTIGFPDLDAQNGNDIVIQHAGITFRLMTVRCHQRPTSIRASTETANYATVGFPQLDGLNGADL